MFRQRTSRYPGNRESVGRNSNLRISRATRNSRAGTFFLFPLNPTIGPPPSIEPSRHPFRNRLVVTERDARRVGPHTRPRATPLHRHPCAPARVRTTRNRRASHIAPEPSASRREHTTRPPEVRASVVVNLKRASRASRLRAFRGVTARVRARARATRHRERARTRRRSALPALPRHSRADRPRHTPPRAAVAST